MTETTTAIRPPSPAVELASRFAEPAWLTSWRDAAWQAFLDAPEPHLEKTDLTGRSWELPLPPAQAGAEQAAAAELLQACADQPWLHIRDGHVVGLHLPEALRAQGVVWTDLHTAAREHEPLLRPHLGQVVAPAESKWSALNAAAWRGGAFLYVPRGVAADAVFHLVYEWSGAAGGCAPRSLVLAGPESSCTFAEVFLTAPGIPAQVAPDVLEVVAEHGAKVQVVSAHTCQRGPVYLSVRRARLAADASVDWVVSQTGDGLAVATVESELAGTGSRSTLQGVGLGTGRQHLDLTAGMHHQGRYSQSDIRLQGVLRGRANTIFRSSTHIAKGAVGAGSEQHSRMLMLERSARADAIPMLLIDENDVQRCGHAASVGRIDETQVYYLMSRGIPRSLATKMIIWGYLEPALEVIPSEPVRHHIVSLIDRELGL